MINKFFVTIMVFLGTLLLWNCSDGGTANDNTNNEPGEIIAVTVPDSMSIPPPGYFNRKLVTAEVSDPDGLKDVDSVYFYSRKPDGQLANKGLPIPLVDNGKSFNINNPGTETGDVKANDGIYSLSIITQINDSLGTYVFTFYMRDKAGHLSEPVIDSVEVHQ